MLNLTDGMSRDAILDFTMAHEYTKIVLQADYNVANGLDEDEWGDEVTVLNGENIILDLNGYTYNYSYQGCDSNSVGFCATNLEIRDSSATGTGIIKLCLLNLWPNKSGTHIVVRGGILDCELLEVYNRNGAGMEFCIYDGVVNGFIRYNIDYIGTTSLFHMEGGSVQEVGFWSNKVHDNYSITMELSPYIVGDFTKSIDGDSYTVARNLTAVAEYCAVSSSNLVSGVYNYAYGLVWEISAAELNKMTIPSDKVYYLWGRTKDGWYHCLDLRYVDGKLV